MDSFAVFDILVFSVIWLFLIFTNLVFTKWKPPLKWPKHVGIGVLLTHAKVNITISEHVEVTRTVNAVSESKNIHKRGFREHCSLSLWHVRKRSFLGPEFTKFYLAAELRPDTLGELTALPQTPSCMKGGEGDGNERERERKGPTGSTEKKRDQGTGRGTWK